MDIGPVIAAILPTIGLSVLFYYVMRTVINADRNERIAQAEYEAQERRAERAENTPPTTTKAHSTDD